MSFDDVLTRVQGAIDLIRGREALGWKRLDLSADGFWNSFLAIPVCLPAFLVVWIAHTQWLAADGGNAASPGAVIALAGIEVAVWIATIALVFALASMLGFSDRAVPTVIAANWGSVVFAYVQAVPAALALLVGVGPGVGFVSIVIMVAVLVAYWRLLAAALERPAPLVGALFVSSIALGYALSSWGQSAFGLLPTA